MPTRRSRRAPSEGEVLRIPINHFEGNWYADDDVLEEMRTNGQIVLRYVDNPNGSLDDVAGIVNEAGNVFGLMPHPEACLRIVARLRGRRRDPRLDDRLTCTAQSTPRIGVTRPALDRPPRAGADGRRVRGDRATARARPDATPNSRCSRSCGASTAPTSRAACTSTTLPTEGRAHPGRARERGPGSSRSLPGVAVAWKIESHNHPSFVEPFNGAATGVGGIVRDILSMGARPIALLDSLRFGPLDDPRTAYLVDGVVHGISSYGNSIGVPTVGGETVFEDCYAENPLVNVACLGVIEDKLMHGRAEGPGQQGRPDRFVAPDATASAARACSRRPSSTRTRSTSARRFRSAIRSPRSC